MGAAIATSREGFGISYGEDRASVHSSELFADWESRDSTPSKKVNAWTCVREAWSFFGAWGLPPGEHNTKAA